MIAALLEIILKGNTTDADRALKEFSGKAKANFDKLDESLAGFGKRLAGILTIGGLVKLTNDTLRNAEAMATLAKNAGMTVEAYSGLVAAGSKVRLNSDDIARGLNALSRAAFSAAGGSGEAVAAWKALGISVTESSGRMVSMETLLGKVSDAFQQLPSGVQKSALAAKLFGEEAGVRMIPLLDKGSAGLRELAAEAQAAGVVVTQSFAEDAARVNDNLRGIATGAKGVANALVAEMAPAIISISATVKEFVKVYGASLLSFLKELREPLGAVATLSIRVVEGISQIGMLTTSRMKMWAAQLRGDNATAVEVYNQQIRESIRLSDEADKLIARIQGKTKADDPASPPPPPPPPVIDASAWVAFGLAIHNEWLKLRQSNLEQVDKWEEEQKRALAKVGEAGTAMYEVQYAEIEEIAKAKRQEIARKQIAETEDTLREIEEASIESERRMADARAGIRMAALDNAARRVESNQYATEEEKGRVLVDIYFAQANAIRDQIAAKTLLQAEAVTDEERIGFERELLDLRNQEADAIQRISEIQDRSTFFGTLRRDIVALRNEWGNMAVTMARTITGTVTSAVQGLSNALANVIVGTQSAAVAFQQFAVQMVTSFIASVIQMILMAKVAIPILTALGVLSGGSIPAAGSVATIASVGAAVAATSGYADGGVIRPGTGPRADDVLIRASRGEYVMPADKTAVYLPLLEAMRQGLVNMRDYADAIPRGLSAPSRGGRYADGGMVSGGVGTSVSVTPAPVYVHPVISHSDILDALQTQKGQHVLLTVLGSTQARARLGIRT